MGGWDRDSLCIGEASGGLFSEVFSKECSSRLPGGWALDILGAVQAPAEQALLKAETLPPPTACRPVPHRALCSVWCPRVWSTGCYPDCSREQMSSPFQGDEKVKRSLLPVQNRGGGWGLVPLCPAWCPGPAPTTLRPPTSEPLGLGCSARLGCLSPCSVDLVNTPSSLPTCQSFSNSVSGYLLSYSLLIISSVPTCQGGGVQGVKETNACGQYALFNEKSSFFQKSNSVNSIFIFFKHPDGKGFFFPPD